MKLAHIVCFVLFISIEIRYGLASRDNETNTIINYISDIDTMCTTTKCVMKCCPMNKVVKVARRKGLISRRCTFYHEIPPLSSISQNLSDLAVKAGVMETNAAFTYSAVDLSIIKNETNGIVHMDQDAQLTLEIPNIYNRWMKFSYNELCYDFKIVRSTNQTNILKPVIYAALKDDAMEKTSRLTLLTANGEAKEIYVGMGISCFFLVLVLVVYVLLKKQRHLSGMIIMSYVSAVLGAFSLILTIHGPALTVPECKFFTFFVYFFFMASFCWMNVMSYDICREVGRQVHPLIIGRSEQGMRFLMYSLYAWGIPLAMALGMMVINEMDLTHLPWFVKPNIPRMGCFLEGGHLFLYLYVPMAILIICNWIFFFKIIFSIWRVRREIAAFDDGAGGTSQSYTSSKLNMKLSILMGLSWVMEVVNYMVPSYRMWFISAIYNSLIGVAIFFILVCKARTLRELGKLFMRQKKSHGMVINK